MHKISIALTTYNGARYLREQLKSYLTQTRLPDELVIGDDKSSDTTVEIIEEFAVSAPFPVHIEINKENLGSTRNFEQVIKRCGGDLIFLSDQDDVWFPQKIERMAVEFEISGKTGMVFSNAEIVDERLRSVGGQLWDFTFSEKKRVLARSSGIFNVLLSQNLTTGATMAFRAEFRDAFIPMPTEIPNLIHDGWISLVIADRANVVFIDEALIKYRQHEGQQLGIGLKSMQSASHGARKQRYLDSIEFCEGELIRLKQLKELFAEHQLFARRAETIDFTGLIAEKLEQIAHYKTRECLPISRAGRFAPIAKEMVKGRYHRFSKGFRSGIKDLLEGW